MSQFSFVLEKINNIDNNYIRIMNIDTSDIHVENLGYLNEKVEKIWNENLCLFINVYLYYFRNVQN